MQAICSTASEFLCNPSKGRKLSSCNNETEYDFQAAAEVSRVSFINSPPMCLFTTSKLERGRVGAAEPNFCVETETLALKQFSAFLRKNLRFELDSMRGSQNSTSSEFVFYLEIDYFFMNEHSQSIKI